MDVRALRLDLNKRTTVHRTINNVLSGIRIIARIPREQDVPLIAFCMQVCRRWRCLLDANVIEEHRMWVSIRVTLQEDDRVCSGRLEWPNRSRVERAHRNQQTRPLTGGELMRVIAKANLLREAVAGIVQANQWQLRSLHRLFRIQPQGERVA